MPRKPRRKGVRPVGLLLAADASSPPDYSTLPPGVEVMLGYLGQMRCTPHVWSVQEVVAAQRRFRAFWPIWVPPQGTQSEASGRADARSMLSVLAHYPIPHNTPVFLDIERSSWDRSPAGARDAIAAWTDEFAAAGWRRAYGYAPLDASLGWVAHWTGVRPAELPAGWVGQQYEGSSAHPGYDLSVFRDTLLDTTSEVALTPAPPTLRQGATGQQVRNWQGLLCAAARPVTIDGTFGPATDAATRDWQAHAGIGVDGIVGPVSWSTALGIHLS